MSKWKDSDEWSTWVCATCEQECFDPDTIKVTTCGNGHTNYLGPVYRSSRAAYATKAELNKRLREDRAVREVMLSAFKKAHPDR